MPRILLGPSMAVMLMAIARSSTPLKSGKPLEMTLERNWPAWLTVLRKAADGAAPTKVKVTSKGSVAAVVGAAVDADVDGADVDGADVDAVDAEEDEDDEVDEVVEGLAEDEEGEAEEEEEDVALVLVVVTSGGVAKNTMSLMVWEAAERSPLPWSLML